MAERRTIEKISEPDFVQFNDLASDAVGGKIIFATDEWFAPAANLLKRDPPQFIASAFTEFGKWMDGWETRRKRIPGHDWCIVQLGVPGIIFGFDVDTSFFTGNYAPRVSIQAACLDTPLDFSLVGDRTGMEASESERAAVAKLNSEAWQELVPISSLQPGYSDSCHNYFKVHTSRVTHLRINMFPDGGIARLRVYGVGEREWSSESAQQEVDLVALTNGGVCLGFSDAHFGHPRNMIGLGVASSMADGWETARRLDRPQKLQLDQKGVLQVSGSEWAVFRLGHKGVVSHIEIDTRHFKGNAPDSCTVEACVLTPEEEAQCVASKWTSAKWSVLLPTRRLRPHYSHMFLEAELRPHDAVSHIRFVIAPDGGVSRLRVWGRAVLDVNSEGEAKSANQMTGQSKL
uniref:Allantoate amidinohydrolase n=1 Tax=Periophthalmus magnuspinnatus TaxID=409849 RepID=A0A3B4AW07_9GOBI